MSKPAIALESDHAQNSENKPWALELNNVTKQFTTGNRTVDALKDLSVGVSFGKVTGLIGPDGAGKTTLMRLAAALLRPQQGEVHVLGHHNVKEALKIQSLVGYMPQRFGLYEDLSVLENLELYADLQGVPKQVRKKRYDELMQMTGLAPFLSRLAGKLSGGMKQKLGLACTLVHPPRLLLLDEPTVGVDPVSRRELWEIVNRFVAEEETTVLISTAYLDEAERCDEVIILNEGELLGKGKPSQFETPLQGQVFEVTISGMKNRDAQRILSHHPQIIDAVIHGDAVRIVWRTKQTPVLNDYFPQDQSINIKEVAPRFEDGFIAMLKQHHEKNDATSDNKNSNIETEPPIQVPAQNSSGDQSNSSSKQEPIIRAEDVKRRFGDFYAVKGVSFDVAPGEVFGLLGANGAGKTTMFRMLCGLLPSSSGKLFVAGVDVRKTAAVARAQIGYMSQKFSLYGSLSVLDNLRFFSSAYGLKNQHRKDRIEWAVEEFELTSVTQTNSGTLPLGYKQRLALACALMHEPKIIFLDEPTSGVDPLARREFWERISDLSSRGITIMVTTHFMEEAEYCDRMAIMIRGEVLALGTPTQIKQKAGSEEKPLLTMEDAFIHLIETHDQQVKA